jgi:hypothetical protein|tara:strand:- start:10441 stop:10716 length:276 start_codon:yes stop_codon:yes gene_type:complete
MSQSKNKMIPGEALIYERADGVVYARYRDPPHRDIPRWIIGGDPAGVARANGDLLSYAEWQEMVELSMKYPTLKKLLDQVVTTYYTVKDTH